MKISIDADSQEEFDQKRHELIKAIAGSKFEVEVRKVGQRRPTDSRPLHYKAQQEMMDFWDEKFKATLISIKEEISEIIG